jgi:hypothetical protein
MKNKGLFVFLVIPTLVLFGLVFLKKQKHPAAFQGVQEPVRIDGKDLRGSAVIWTNREFVHIVKNEENIRIIIQNFITPLLLSDKEKSNALSSCFGMIKAYGAGDWEEFMAVRIPISGYEVTKEAISQYALNISETKISDADQAYKTYWKTTFQESPLFSEVSFVSNSVSLFNLSQIKIKEIHPPEFTDKLHQRWIENTLTKVYDYPNIAKINEAKVLRLFFFSKDNKIPGFVQILFVLNGDDGLWLPYSFTLGIVQKPTHDLYLF